MDPFPYLTDTKLLTLPNVDCIIRHKHDPWTPRNHLYDNPANHLFRGQAGGKIWRRWRINICMSGLSRVICKPKHFDSTDCNI